MKKKKMVLIGVIGTVQSYLAKWGEILNFGNTVTEIVRKSMKEKKDEWLMKGRENWISVMRLPKFLSCQALAHEVKCPKRMLGGVLERESNCGNQVAEIVRNGWKRHYKYIIRVTKL